MIVAAIRWAEHLGEPCPYCGEAMIATRDHLMAPKSPSRGNVPRMSRESDAHVPRRSAPVRYLSVCSGLEGATLAWHSLGWTAVGFAEIEAFPSAILAERFGSNLPSEPLPGNAPPNFGDFTTIDLERLGAVDLLVGGTPCQAFSIAGKKLSLADARGNLSLAYVVLAHELAQSHGLRNCLWENVPGVFATHDNAFGCFLGSLVGGDDPIEPVAKPARGKSNKFWRWRAAGTEVDDDGNEIAVAEGHVTRWPSAGMVAGPLGRAAWRVLDAQYFGLAQRRERVFVVGDFGDGADPAAVLFERPSVPGNPAPRRGEGQGIAGVAARGAGGGGGGRGSVAFGGNRSAGPLDVATAVNAHGGPHGRLDFESETFIAFQTRGGNLNVGDKSGTLGTNADRASGGAPMIAHALRAEGFDASEDGTGRGTPIVPVLVFPARLSGTQYASTENLAPALSASNPTAIAFSSKDHDADAANDLSPTLRVMGQVAVAFAQNTRDEVRLQGGDGQIVGALAAEPGMKQTTYVAEAIAIQDVRGLAKKQNGGGFNTDGIAYTVDTHATQGGAHPVVDAFAFDLRGRDGGAVPEGPHDTGNIRAASGGSSRSYVAQAYAIQERAVSENIDAGPQGKGFAEEIAYTLEARGSASQVQAVATRWAVRRLTPTECARLQGVPDDWCRIPWRGKPAEQCPDGPFYRALGNGFAVPVVAWIGRRIDAALRAKDQP